MRIVIEISETKYLSLKKCLENGIALGMTDIAILNGTPLPKGHGRLIDADALVKYIENEEICNGCVSLGFGCKYHCTFPDSIDYQWEKCFREQKTVVEADKEGAEE